MHIDEIPAGTSWACRFKTWTFLDENAQPVEAKNLQIGQAHPGEPQEYQSIGVIQVRDSANQRVQLQCVESFKQFTVAYEDCWDIDQVEWQDNE